MKRLLPRLLIAVLLLLSRPGARAEDTFADGVVSSDPSPDDDEARAVALDVGAIYVGGVDAVAGPWRWRIEKRARVDGRLVPEFGTGGVVTSDPSPRWDSISAMVTDGASLYVVGVDDTFTTTFDDRWRIERRQTSDGALVAGFGVGGVVTSNPTAGNDRAFGVTVDGAAMYVVGEEDGAWRIEKRRLLDGSLVAGFGSGGAVTSDPTTGADVAQAVALDGSTLWVGGYADAVDWRIEKRDAASGALLFGETEALAGVECGSNGVLALAIDGGALYLAGSAEGNWRVERRDVSDGRLVYAQVVTPHTTQCDAGRAIALDGGFLDVAGQYGSSDTWRVERRSKVNGALASGFGASGFVTGPGKSANGTVLSDGILYLVGDARVNVDDAWRIERRKAATGELITTPPISGSIVVTDRSPGSDPSRRRVVAVARKPGSLDSVVGDPIANGAKLLVVANGAHPTAQEFELPGGASVAGAPGWRALGNPVTGYSYKDALGVSTPVTSLLARRTSGGTFTLKAVVDGSRGPGAQPHVQIVPPAPGTDATVILTILGAGGGTSCATYGGAAGGLVRNLPGTFRISSTPTHPLVEADCPTPPPATTSTSTSTVPTTSSTSTSSTSSSSSSSTSRTTTSSTSLTTLACPARVVFGSAMGTTYCGNAGLQSGPGLPFSGAIFQSTVGGAPVGYLGLGCMYSGGAAVSVNPLRLGDGATAALDVSACHGTSIDVVAGSGSGVIAANGNPWGGPDPGKDCTLGPSSTRHCTRSGTPCAGDADCGGPGLCNPDPRCIFGPPRPLPQGSLSMCILDAFGGDAGGSIDALTGAATLALPLVDYLYLAGNTQKFCFDGAPGRNGLGSCVTDADCSGVSGACRTEPACPVCASTASGFSCISGRSHGSSCTPSGADQTSLDCLPAGGDFLATATPTMPPFDTGTSVLTAVVNPARNGERFFCPLGGADTCVYSSSAARGSTCQRSQGAFGLPTIGRIEEYGSPAGNLTDHLMHPVALATTFCIPATGNGFVDSGFSDLPGPGAVSLRGSLQLIP